MSDEIFEKLQLGSVLKPVPYTVVLADGSDLKIQGQTDLPIWLGQKCMIQKVVVGSIKNDAILGVDFLKENRCLLDLKLSLIKIDEIELPLFSDSDGAVDSIQVHIMNDVTVPANSEKLVACFLHKKQCGTQCDRYQMVEGLPQIHQQHGILVARSLIDNQHTPILRVLNPSE